MPRHNRLAWPSLAIPHLDTPCPNRHNSPNQSQPDYPINVTPGTYKIVLNTDDPNYGGHGILKNIKPFKTQKETLKIYIPARTGLVLKRTS